MAVALGKTRRELLDGMDSRELSEWIAYDRVEPIPQPWQETGLLAAILCNLLGTGRRRSPADFIPARRAPAEEQSPSAILAAFQGMRDAMIARHAGA